MNFPISIRLYKLCFYLIGFVFFYLAGAYFGFIFKTMFLVYIFLPIGSLFQLIATWISIKYYQDFNTNHPLKGQEVKYTITLTKESVIPSSHVIIQFKATQQEMDLNFDDVHEIPGKFHSFIAEKIIKCPFRGVYTVGLSALIIEDIMRWIRINIPVWHRTFYVYPRIIELNSVQLGIQGQRTDISGSIEGTVQDLTLFEALRDYRTGDATRHIAWKKFASLGTPFLKTYDMTAQPGVTIYLDTRRTGEPDYRTLMAEDCSVEIMIAIVKALTYRDIPVAVHTYEWGRYYFTGNNETLFTRFHQNTVGIYFKPGPSPVELFRADIADNRLTTQSVLFITHVLDPEILNLFESSTGREIITAAVFNISAFSDKDKEKARYMIRNLHENEGHVFIVNDAETIKEDLE